LGGLARRATEIQGIRNDVPNVILLSAGGFSPKPDNFSEPAIAAELEAMSLMRYDAIALGHRELALDPRILNDQIAINHSPVVCSNIFRNGEYYGERYGILQVGEITIGILAAVTPLKDVDESAANSPWTIADVERSLQPVINEIAPKTDALILLSQLGLWNTLDIIGKFPQIDIAVIGDEGKTVQNPIQYGETLVVMSGNRGQYLGKLDLTFDIEGLILSYQGTLIPLDETIPDDPEIAGLVAEFKSRVEEIAADSDEIVTNKSGTGSAAPRKYIGDTSCQACHSWIYAKWKVTPHRVAYQTLHREGQASNADCIACHVVGYHDGGFVNFETTPQLVDVQCESCHGRASRHVENPSAVKLDPVTETTCLQCHCGKWGDNFDYSAAVKSVH
jgi:hypothetical protein